MWLFLKCLIPPNHLGKPVVVIGNMVLGVNISLGQAAGSGLGDLH